MFELIKDCNDWNDFLLSEFKKTYFDSLKIFLNQEYKEHICYPPINQIFNSFYLCPLNNLKVIILGQDPYHSKGQANGLAFSVNNGVSHPPSLVNIFKELKNDLCVPYPIKGDLSSWASQGVFLLNSTLTVREGCPRSHQDKGWEKFTDNLIKTISENYSNIVFMLWGSYAKKKNNFINNKKHLVLECGHPSPLSANRGYWFGNRHFSKANAYLKSIKKEPINWKI